MVRFIRGSARFVLCKVRINSYFCKTENTNNLYEKELSEKYEKEYRKTFDKLSRQISFYEDAQKHNEYYVGSNKEFERIFKHVIYQFDRIIYRKFCLKNI